MVNSGERIVVVESNPEISDLISRQALQPLGYQVSVVKSASAVLQQALQTPPDLFIANLNLPGLNAKDLLVALSSQGIDVPLVVIAGKGQEEDILQTFRLGAVDYLHWPARDAEVVSVVERALRMTREGRVRVRLDKQLQNVNAEMQRKVNDLTTIVDIGKAVVSITDHRRLFTRIVEGAVKVADADLGWLMLRDEISRAFLLTAQRSLPDAWAQKMNQPLEDGISSLVTLSGETLLIHGKPLEKFKVASLGRSAAVVPIKVQNEVIGLRLLRKAEHPSTVPIKPCSKRSRTMLRFLWSMRVCSALSSRRLKLPTRGQDSVMPCWKLSENLCVMRSRQQNIRLSLCWQ
jgi:DNA-binding response OmpR family regulator